MIEDIFQIIGIITVMYWISKPLIKLTNELIIKFLVWGMTDG